MNNNCNVENECGHYISCDSGKIQTDGQRERHTETEKNYEVKKKDKGMK